MDLLSSIGKTIATVTLATIPVAAAAAAAATIGGAGVAVVGAFGAGVVWASLHISQQVHDWARMGQKSSRTKPIFEDLILHERQAEGLSPKFRHIAVCGVAGSGKTSLVNALRGLRNGQPEAAKTGVVETTLSRSSYTAHSSIDSLVIHDIPGAGTQSIPAAEYFYTQKLYLFDSVLIVQGERFGEVCIQNAHRLKRAF